MANQIHRDDAQEQFNEALGQELFGQSPSECIGKDVCVSCGGDATDFKDNLSKREFQISGLCQKCQDSIFG